MTRARREEDGSGTEQSVRIQTIVSMTSAEVSPSTHLYSVVVPVVDGDDDGSFRDSDDGMENFVAQSVSTAVIDEMSSAS